MKVNIVITLDSEDHVWDTRVDHAFNRVMEFAPELRDPPRKGEDKNVHRTTYNRIVNGEFSVADARRLALYTASVAERVNSRAAEYDKADQSVLAAGLRQAASNLTDTVAEFAAWAVHAAQSSIGNLLHP